MKVRLIVLITLLYSSSSQCINSPEEMVDQLKTDESGQPEKQQSTWQKAKKLILKHKKEAAVVSTATLAAICILAWRHANPGPKEPPTPGSSGGSTSSQTLVQTEGTSGGGEPDIPRTQQPPAQTTSEPVQPAADLPYLAKEFPLRSPTYWEGTVYASGRSSSDKMPTEYFGIKDGKYEHTSVFHSVRYAREKAQTKAPQKEVDKISFAQVPEKGAIVPLFYEKRWGTMNLCFVHPVKDSADPVKYSDNPEIIFLTLPKGFTPTGKVNATQLSAMNRKEPEFRIRAGVAQRIIKDANGVESLEKVLYAGDYPHYCLQPKALTKEELHRLELIEKYPIKSPSFWNGYVVTSRQGKDVWAPEYVKYDAIQAGLLPLEWMNSEQRYDKLKNKAIPTDEITVTGARSDPEAPLLAWNTTIGLLKNEYGFCFRGIDLQKKAYDAYLSLPSNFRPTGKLSYIWLSTVPDPSAQGPQQSKFEYRVLTGIAKDEEGNEVFYAAGIPEYVTSLTGDTSAKPGMGTKQDTPPQSFKASDWAGLLTNRGRKEVTKVGGKHFLYLPLTVEQQENAKKKYETNPENNYVIQGENVCEELFPAFASQALPVYEEDQGLFFLAYGNDPAKSYKVYLTTDFTPINETITLNVDSVLQHGFSHLPARKYAITAGIGQDLTGSYVLYVSEKPKLLQPKP